MLSRKNKILIAAQLAMTPAQFVRFKPHLEEQYEELCKDIFEYTVRGMGDHSTSIVRLDQAAGTFDCKCSCGKAQFLGVTLRTLWTRWSCHIQLEQLEEFKRSGVTPEAASPEAKSEQV